MEKIIEDRIDKALSERIHCRIRYYFEIGKMIVEDEFNGQKRADYGKKILKNLSEKLTENFGKGFSERNLLNMKNFYKAYSISQKPSAEFKLSFSHYLILSRMNNIEDRKSDV